MSLASKAPRMGLANNFLLGFVQGVEPHDSFGGQLDFYGIGVLTQLIPERGEEHVPLFSNAFIVP
jgi:hypothetical protein